MGSIPAWLSAVHFINDRWLAQALPIDRSSRFGNATKLSPSRRTSITGQSSLVLAEATHSAPTRPTEMSPRYQGWLPCLGHSWLARQHPGKVGTALRKWRKAFAHSE